MSPLENFALVNRAYIILWKNVDMYNCGKLKYQPL